MRLYKTHGQEKWFVFIPVEVINRFGGCFIIAMCFSFTFQHDDPVGTGGPCAFIGGHYGCGAPVIGIGALGNVGVDGFSAFGPRYLVVDATMKNFAGAQSGVTIL